MIHILVLCSFLFLRDSTQCPTLTTTVPENTVTRTTGMMTSSEEGIILEIDLGSTQAPDLATDQFSKNSSNEIFKTSSSQISTKSPDLATDQFSTNCSHEIFKRSSSQIPTKSPDMKSTSPRSTLSAKTTSVSTLPPTTPRISTKVPSTKVPSTKVPSTKVPSTKVPSTKVPSTKVPSTKVPSTKYSTSTMNPITSTIPMTTTDHQFGRIRWIVILLRKLLFMRPEKYYRMRYRFCIVFRRRNCFCQYLWHLKRPCTCKRFCRQKWLRVRKYGR